MPTRDPKTGQFVKQDAWEQMLDSGLERDISKFIKSAPKRQIRRWLSHHRLTITFYAAYIALCFVAGAIGALLGVRLGL